MAKYKVVLTAKGPLGSGKGAILAICEDALIAAGYVVWKEVENKHNERSIEVIKA